MPDVLLLYPKAGHDVRGVSVNAPLALLTLAARLVPDFDVQILDQRACDDFWGDVKRALATKPLLVGTTAMTGTQIYHALEITKFVKAHAEVPVVWGGMHPTIYPAQTVAKPYIDFVIKDEGEESLRLLVELLAAKRRNFETVPALYWKEQGRLRATPLGDPLDIDKSPKIPWHLIQVEEYVSPSQYLYPGVSRLLPFQGSRGCPFKCTFCSEPVLTRKYRMMNPAKMVDECLEMVDTYKLDHVTFFDEELFVNVRWATEVAERINGRFTWWAQTRGNDLRRVDLKQMERCGLRVVAPGLESGSNRVLSYIKKNEKVEEYIEANRLLAETSIIPQYNFIIGYPTETVAELHETIDLVLRLIDENKNTAVNQLSPLTPLPGTELLKQAIKDHGFVEPKRLEDWIRITRGKQDRSWLDPKTLRIVKFLYYTSLFLCSAERYGQKLKIPDFVFKLYSQTIRLRWKRKWLNIDPEIPLLRLLFRLFINPIDYNLPADYGDAHTAQDSDVEMVSPAPEIRAPLGGSDRRYPPLPVR
jgi:anaerobic magnesium-protoporphyrin IX monomethyl ester cyclase